MTLMSVSSAPRCPGCFVRHDSADTLCVSCIARPEFWTALACGTTLSDRYIIGLPLGEPGGFGITYYAWDRTLERRVAVKEFYPQFLQPVRAQDGRVSVSIPSGNDMFTAFLDGFLDEGRRAAAVGHDHVVKILDFLQAFGTGYLIMPYYEGETLKAFHRGRGGGALPWREALTLTLPIIDALRAVHEVGVIHRDVKPANIYLAQSADGPRPILLDFGAARVSGSARQFTAVLTERYAPLEQYDAESTGQGAWTDIYAIGATLLELLTGQVPPAAPSRQFGAALPDLSTAQPTAPREIVDAIDRALRLDPAQRTREARTLYDELRHALDAPPGNPTRRPVAPPTAVVERDTGRREKPVRIATVAGTRRRAMMVGSAFGAIGLIGAIAVFWLVAWSSNPTVQDTTPPHSARQPPLTAPLAPAGRSTQKLPVHLTPQPKHDSGTRRVGQEPAAHNGRDSAEVLMRQGDYTNAWIRARIAGAPDLLRRIADACRQDSLIAARRNETVGCPR
jgi:serine/threonine protein kinase